MPEAIDDNPSREKSLLDPGWRGVIGFISPPPGPNTMDEFMRIAPEGFRAVSTIAYTPGFKLNAEQVTETAKQLETCCLALKQAHADVIAQSGTPFAFLTGDFRASRDFCARLEKVSGVPVVMMGLAVTNALNRMKYSSVGVACTYYSDEIAAQYTKFLEESGVKVQAMENWVSQGIFEKQEELDVLRKRKISMSRIPVGLVYDAAKRVASHCPTAECIVISGGGVCTMDIIQALEQDVGKPVISSAAATLWEIFIRLGVSPVIRGRGGLLASLGQSS